MNNNDTVYFHSGSSDGSGMLPDTSGTEFPVPLDLDAVHRQAEAFVREAIEACDEDVDWSGWECGAYLDGAQLLTVSFPSKSASSE